MPLRDLVHDLVVVLFGSITLTRKPLCQEKGRERTGAKTLEPNRIVSNLTWCPLLHGYQFTNGLLYYQSVTQNFFVFPA